MRYQRIVGTLLALVVLCAGSRNAVSADVVDQIPPNALAYVVVKNMRQANDAVSRLAQQMQLPSPDLLALAGQRLNLTQGVDETGDLAIVLMGQQTGGPFPVIYVRAKDYERLLASLNPGDQEEQVRRVTLGGKPTLVAQKGPYAVFAPPTYRDGLKQVITSQKSIQLNDQIRTFAGQAQVYAVVTSAGVRMLSQQAIAGLQMLKQRVSQAGPQSETVVAAVAMYEQLFKWAAKEVAQVAVTLQIDNNSNVVLRKRVDFQNPGQYTARGTAADATKQLAMLPAWPYVMAFAGEMGESKAMDMWIKLSLDMMRSMLGPKALTDEQTEKFTEITRKTLKGVRGMAFTFGVPKAGGSIYSRMAMVMTVEDAKAYIKDYFHAMQQMQEIFANNAAMPYRILKAEQIQVGGVAGFKIVMHIVPDQIAAGNAQANAALTRLFGKDGNMELYAAPVDAHHVAFAYASEESLEEVMQSAKKLAGQGLGNAAAIGTTAQLLSGKAQWVGYMSPSGLVQYVQRMIETIMPEEQREHLPQIPPFPASPPLGVSFAYDGQALEAEMVAPAESLSALGKYIQTVRQAAGR